MTRYYCSGFDIHNAFGHGLGEMFKRELTDTKSIVFIPGGADKVEKAVKKNIPVFIEHFKNEGIQFEHVGVITPDLSKQEAGELIRNADFVMLMGGNPFKQKELCIKLDLLRELQDNLRETGWTDVSVIKSFNGKLEYYIENEGKVWKATKDGVIPICRI